MENHQDKQEIFDRYAKSQEFDDWNDLLIAFELKLMNSDEFECYVFSACDLVQEEQQNRIAGNAKIQQESCGDSMTCGCMGRCDYPVSYINKKSITNPENKIQ